jgi:hypothetical protein
MKKTKNLGYFSLHPPEATTGARPNPRWLSSNPKSYLEEKNPPSQTSHAAAEMICSGLSRMSSVVLDRVPSLGHFK